MLRIPQGNYHLVAFYAAAVRVNRSWSIFDFGLNPSVTAEVKDVELVSVAHEVVHASEEVHFWLKLSDGVGMPRAWEISFLLYFFPFVLPEGEDDKILEYAWRAAIVAPINV